MTHSERIVSACRWTFAENHGLRIGASNRLDLTCPGGCEWRLGGFAPCRKGSTWRGCSEGKIFLTRIPSTRKRRRSPWQGLEPRPSQTENHANPHAPPPTGPGRRGGDDKKQGVGAQGGGKGGGKGRPPWGWMLLGGAALLIGLWTLGGVEAVWETLFSEISADGADTAQLVKLLLLLTLVGSGVMHLRATGKQTFRYIGLWILIIGVIVIGYAYRDVFEDTGDRVWADLVPHAGREGEGSITFSAREDSHFLVEAQVNGVPVRFLVDTGASDTVLNREDARRLGFDPEHLVFNLRTYTANGVGHGARIWLDRVEVGPILMDNVRASVNKAPMSHSLLGMSFLGRLDSYEIKGNRLTLRAGQASGESPWSSFGTDR